MKVSVLSALLFVSTLAYVAESYTVCGNLGFAGPSMRVHASSSVSRITALTPPLRTSSSVFSSNSFLVRLEMALVVEYCCFSLISDRDFDTYGSHCSACSRV
jgi:hypothetical protein